MLKLFFLCSLVRRLSFSFWISYIICDWLSMWMSCVQNHHKSVLLLINVNYYTLAVGGCCEVSKLDMPYSQYQPTETSFYMFNSFFFCWLWQYCLFNQVTSLKGMSVFSPIGRLDFWLPVMNNGISGFVMCGFMGGQGSLHFQFYLESLRFMILDCSWHNKQAAKGRKCSLKVKQGRMQQSLRRTF